MLKIHAHKIHAHTILFSLYCLLNSFLCVAQKDSLIYTSGKNQFRTYCSSCHSTHQEIYGPMLGSISKKRTEPWLISFIQNSQQVIKSGDPYAKALFEKFNNQVMPTFEKLSKKDIKAILYYLEYESIHPSAHLNDATTVSTNNSSILEGKSEFTEHCSACHFIHKESSFAPALGSVTKRHDRAWIIAFIHNSQKVIQGGDPYAENLYQQFDRHVMTSMDFLEDEEINSILDYIEYASTVDASYTGKINKTEYKKEAQQQIERTFRSPALLKAISLILITVLLTVSAVILYFMLQLKKYFC
ncbi:c-type cytochrome [Cytophaga aurantiaca]|uniref:c-type cytochrome n=1 Tax=Cytophaga aurantiaca TaxID=29530 RepID=UPI0012F91CCB|nr:cytochrome c [Cytophaga aurantiaca]